jgi:glyceraldehyde 3-phosphate dehydrogenase
MVTANEPTADPETGCPTGGPLDGIALRVSVSDGSNVDHVTMPEQETSIEEVNEPFKAAAPDSSHSDVLQHTDKPLVSQDIVGTRRRVLSALDTIAARRVIKMVGWYDNEGRYPNCLVDLVALRAGDVPACSRR